MVKKNESSRPIYSTKIEGIDIMVSTRDGTRLAVDIYRPDATRTIPGFVSLFWS